MPSLIHDQDLRVFRVNHWIVGRFDKETVGVKPYVESTLLLKLIMGADTTPAVALEAPPLTPLSIPNRLAGNPGRPPKYQVTVRNSQGSDVVLSDPNANRGLVALMDVHAVHEGAACHWGGPAAFAEIMSAVHGLLFAEDIPWYEAYHFVNDAGHAENGVYALRANYGFGGMTFEDLKGFRGIESKLTGHGESHLNPEGVFLSNGPLGSAFPQSQGLAMADKVSGKKRTTICVLSDGASMEGEARESFAAIPGLAEKGLMNPYVLIISDNNTKLSGRISEDAFSMQGTFNALSALGWHVIHVEDGHNLEEVYQSIEKGLELARNNSLKPVCLLVKTIKGYGVQSTEDHPAGGHGFPLAGGEKIVEFVDEIFSGKTPPEFAEWAHSLKAEWDQMQVEKKAKPSGAGGVKKDKIQAGLAKAAIRAAQEGLPVFSISADVQGSTGISAFQKAFPDRFREVGVAEANMVSTGAGFAKLGYIPIVDTFGQFGVTKGNLPLTMAALSQAPVIAIFSHVGFQDAADGASHQATTYFAATSAIPHTVVIAPSCAGEAEALMHEAIKRYAEARAKGQDGESYLFFVGRENYPIHWIENASYPWGKAQVVQEGTDVVLVGAGPLFSKAVAAGKILAEQGVKAAVVNNPFVNRVDIETIEPLVRACKGRVVTIEDHQITGGMGSMLAHALVTKGIPVQMHSLGIPGEFGQSAYMAEHLYEKYGLTTENMVATAKGMVE